MRRLWLVPILVLVLALVLGVCGCTSETTTTRADTTDTTAPPSSTGTTSATGGTWTELHPTGSLPSARAGYSMVFDHANGKVILFGGGESSGGPLNDTWTYDPATNTWTEIHPRSAVPPARLGSSMVYDATSGQAILFGGLQPRNPNGVLNDTWAYDPATGTWTELHPTGGPPPARHSHCMVYDSFDGKVILFGGHKNVGGQAVDWTNDMWTYDPMANTWIELHPAGTAPPSAMFGEMVYDTNGGRAILYGTADDGDAARGTWAYDPVANTWTELHPEGSVPSVFFGHMVYDPAAEGVILFGGLGEGLYGEGRFVNDMWTYEPATNTWTELHPTGTAPSNYGLVVYDADGGQAILFGSTRDGGNYLNAAWSYRPAP